MANKSHQMTMLDSHFNSGMIPLCHATLPSIDFFPSSFGTRRETKLILLLLLAPEPWLLTIKVNAGTTFITTSVAGP